MLEPGVCLGERETERERERERGERRERGREGEKERTCGGVWVCSYGAMQGSGSAQRCGFRVWGYALRRSFRTQDNVFEGLRSKVRV
jgi:hypothetical protein